MSEKETYNNESLHIEHRLRLCIEEVERLREGIKAYLNLDMAARIMLSSLIETHELKELVE